MKFRDGVIQEEETIGNFDDIQVEVSKNRTNKMMGILLSNLYSDAIGSIVREITSNCFDAHTAVNSDEPVVIEFTREEGVIYINFIDKGPGMNPDFLKKVYSQLLESTKEESDDFIGAWGLGSKTPLALRNEFYLTTVVDGTKWEYVVYKDGSGLPKITLLTENSVDLPNGTVVKIEICDNTELNKFKKALKAQLAYFDNVIVKTNNIIYDYNNYYKIIESELFLVRNDIDYDVFNYPHIVLGKVSYPINFNILGLNPNYYSSLWNIGIKFPIGSLMVQPNRENIIYDEEAIKLIKKKLDEVCLWLIDRFNEKESEITDFKLYLKSFDEERKLITTFSDNSTSCFSIKSLVNNEYYSNLIKPVYFQPLAQFEKIIGKKNPFFFLKGNYFSEYGGSIKEYKSTLSFTPSLVFENTAIFVKINRKPNKSKTDRLKIEYLEELRSSLNKRRIIFYEELSLKYLYKHKTLNIYFKEFINSHALNKYTVINDFKKAVKNLFCLENYVYDFDNLEIPEEFLKNAKVVSKNFKIDGFIDVIDKIRNCSKKIDLSKEFSTHTTNSYTSSKRNIVNFKNGTLIVGFRNDSKILEKVAYYLNNYAVDKKHPIDKKYKVYVIKKEDLKHFLVTPTFKAYHVSEILTKMKIFIKLNSLHALKNHVVLKSFNKDKIDNFRHYNKYIADCLEYLKDKSDELGYSDAQVMNLITELNENYPTLKKQILPEIKLRINKIDEYFKDIEESTLFNYSLINSKPNPLIVNYLKKNKKKVNLELYSLKEFPEIPKEIRETRLLVETPLVDLRNYNPNKPNPVNINHLTTINH